MRSYVFSLQVFEGSFYCLMPPRRRLRPLHGCLSQALLSLLIAAVAVRNLKPGDDTVVVLPGAQLGATEVLATLTGRGGIRPFLGLSAEML